MRKRKATTSDTTASKTAKKTNSTKPPPAKKARTVKRDRPKMFYTLEHFKGSKDVILKTPDRMTKIEDFRLMFNEESTRCVTFMNNSFVGHKGDVVVKPTIFFSNFWVEKLANIKNPEVSNFFKCLFALIFNPHGSFRTLGKSARGTKTFWTPPIDHSIIGVWENLQNFLYTTPCEN